MYISVHVLLSLCFNVKLFKHPLEKEGQVGGPILAQEEIKTIFGSIPDIYDVHTRIKVGYWKCPNCCWLCNYWIGVTELIFSICGGLSPAWPWGAPDRLVRGKKRGRHHSQICELKNIKNIHLQVSFFCTVSVLVFLCVWPVHIFFF